MAPNSRAAGEARLMFITLASPLGLSRARSPRLGASWPQHHAVRRRACLFVADIEVAHEPSMVIDGSPPVGAVHRPASGGCRIKRRVK